MTMRPARRDGRRGFEVWGSFCRRHTSDVTTTFVRSVSRPPGRPFPPTAGSGPTTIPPGLVRTSPTWSRRLPEGRNRGRDSGRVLPPFLVPLGAPSPPSAGSHTCDVCGVCVVLRRPLVPTCVCPVSPSSGNRFQRSSISFYFFKGNRNCHREGSR